MILRKIQYFLIGLFVLPYALILNHLELKMDLSASELIWAFKNTMIQSVSSSMLSVLLGFLMAMSLISINKKIRRFFDVILLLPSLVPSFYIILALMKIINPFPFGNLGVLLVNVTIYFGYFTFLIVNILETQYGSFIETALVNGAKWTDLIFKILFPLMKFDLLILFILGLQIFFTSFSIPILVGAQDSLTIELLIYEKMKLGNAWAEAAIIGLIQTSILFFLTLLVKNNIIHNKAIKVRQKITTEFIIYAGIFYISLIFISYFSTLIESHLFLNFINENKQQITELLLKSFVSSLLVYFLLRYLLKITSFFYYFHPMKKFILIYFAPSVSLTCLAFLTWGSNYGVQVYFKIPLIFILLYSISLFKIGLINALDQIEPQKNIANLLGGSSWQTFQLVIYPQVKSTIINISQLGVIFYLGDFSIGKLLAFQNVNFAMLVQSLMQGYKIGIASWMGLLLIFLILISLITIRIVENVIDKKFNFKAR